MSNNNNRYYRGNNTKYGLCTNMEPKQDGTKCSLCQKKEKQAIRATKDFVCSECGAPLTEVTGSGSFPTKLIVTIVSIILFVVAVVIGIMNHNGGEQGPGNPPNDTLIDTIKPSPDPSRDTVILHDTIFITVNDTTYIYVHDTILDIIIKEVPTGEKKLSNWGTYTLDWGTYSGPMKGGKPADGVSGEIKITKEYQIDLKDGRGSTLDVKRGDIIVNPKFKNGKFMLQGELHRPDGTRRVL